MPRGERVVWAALLLAGCAAGAPPREPGIPASPPVAVAPAPPDDGPMGAFDGSRSVAVPLVAPEPVPPAPTPSPPAPIPSPTPPATPPPPVAAAKPGADTLVATLLGRGGAAVRAALATPEKLKLQVSYALVRTNEKGAFSLERHGFRADAEYFFPASSMKVPIALAGYERLPAMRAAGRPSLDRDATLRLYPSSGEGEPFTTTLARETWRAIIVSDNAAANRLLSFVGHREANEALWNLKLASARIRSGFSMAADADPVEASPRIGVVAKDGAVEEIAPRKSTLELPPTKASGLSIGVGYVEAGRRVAGPMSFATKNAMTLRDLQDTLVRIMRPELLSKTLPASHAASADIAYLRQALGTLPSKSGIAGFDRNVVADYQLVPFLRGLERVLPRDKFEIYTKVGQAYGFLTGNAYVVEKDTGKAFFLAATVYANRNEILNDDVYEYDTVAFPVLADVAEAAARHAFGK